MSNEKHIELKNIKNEIVTIELAVKLSECLTRLEKNSDFQTLFLNHFLRDNQDKAMTMLAAGGKYAEQAIHNLTVIASIQGELESIKKVAQEAPYKIKEKKDFIRKLEQGD